MDSVGISTIEGEYYFSLPSLTSHLLTHMLIWSVYGCTAYTAFPLFSAWCLELELQSYNVKKKDQEKQSYRNLDIIEWLNPKLATIDISFSCHVRGSQGVYLCECYPGLPGSPFRISGFILPASRKIMSLCLLSCWTLFQNGISWRTLPHSTICPLPGEACIQ